MIPQEKWDRLNNPKSLEDYGISLREEELRSFPEGRALLLELGLYKSMKNGDDSCLRETPEGRAFLLGHAKEKRKVPVFLRRSFNKVAGENAAKTIDNLILKVLKCGIPTEGPMEPQED